MRRFAPLCRLHIGRQLRLVEADLLRGQADGKVELVPALALRAHRGRLCKRQAAVQPLHRRAHEHQRAMLREQLGEEDLPVSPLRWDMGYADDAPALLPEPAAAHESATPSLLKSLAQLAEAFQQPALRFSGSFPSRHKHPLSVPRVPARSCGAANHRAPVRVPQRRPSTSPASLPQRPAR